MKTEWVLSQEAFDSCLAWLDPDRDRAGEKYEEIRRKLIKKFVHLVYRDPEGLTYEGINRVIRKIREIAGTAVSDPMLHFYAEARRVFIVYRGKGPDASLLHRVKSKGGESEVVLRDVGGRSVLKAES